MQRCAGCWRLRRSAVSSPSPPFPPQWRNGCRPGGRRLAGDIAGRLEAQGYVLIAPLQRRPGVYLADVRAGPAGYQRLVIDDRNGEILERFSSSPRGFGYPPRRFGPEFAGRYDGFPTARRRASSSRPPAPDTRIRRTADRRTRAFRAPSARSTRRWRRSRRSRNPPRSPARSRQQRPPRRWFAPPLPPPAPREAAKPEEAPSAPTPAPKIESPPGESENASWRRAPPKSRRQTSRPSASAAAGPPAAAFFRRGARQVEGQHRSGGAVRIDEKGRPIGRPRFARDPRRSAYAACAVGALTASIVLPPLLIAMVRGF